MNLDIETFQDLLTKSRSKETSVDPENWTPQNPSRGQCLVSSILADEVLGLAVIKEKIVLRDGSNWFHFFNSDKNNDYDFCKEQFKNETIIRKKTDKLSKENIRLILEFYSDIRKKYEILKNNFKQSYFNTFQEEKQF